MNLSSKLLHLNLLPAVDLWKLGGIPEAHHTGYRQQWISLIIRKNLPNVTRASCLSHHRLTGHKTQPTNSNKNDDIEQRHHRFKRALDRARMFRGSRDFSTRKEYEIFLEGLFAQLNSDMVDAATCWICWKFFRQPKGFVDDARVAKKLMILDGCLGCCLDGRGVIHKV